MNAHELLQEIRFINNKKAQSAVAVEYTNCISTEGEYFPNKCPGYDLKPSDGETLVLELWGM